MENIFNSIKELQNRKRKIPVSISMDEDLFKILKEIKEREKIESLSPVVNALIWDWVNNQKKKEKQK